MNKRAVIAGAGGFGRGVFSWLAQSPSHRQQFGIEEIVFIDDSPPDIDLPGPILATLKEYVPTVDDVVLPAIGAPRIRQTVVEDLTGRGARFHTFIDDRAVVASDVELGEGSIVCPGTVISAGACLGTFVHVNFNCSIGHDTQLGDFCTLSPAVNIMGDVKVGSQAFFGGNAAVLPRIEVGEQAVVGAGAVVVDPIEVGRIVIGNPASVRGRGPGVQREEDAS